MWRFDGSIQAENSRQVGGAELRRSLERFPGIPAQTKFMASLSGLAPDWSLSAGLPPPFLPLACCEQTQTFAEWRRCGKDCIGGLASCRPITTQVAVLPGRLSFCEAGDRSSRPATGAGSSSGPAECFEPACAGRGILAKAGLSLCRMEAAWQPNASRRRD